jgi:hypothetical protein
MLAPARASWLAFLSLASAWAAGVAGVAVLPLAAAVFAMAPASDAPAVARAVAWMALAFAAAALIYAAASAGVARGLVRGRSWARGGALGLACANLLVPPFGTAHGAYVLWQLLTAPRPADNEGSDADD